MGVSTYLERGCPSIKISSWAPWSLKQRLVLPSNSCFFCFETIFKHNSQYVKSHLDIRTVYMYMRWMDLELWQEMGVRPDVDRGWSTQQNLFLTKSWSARQRIAFQPTFFVCHLNFVLNCCDWPSFYTDQCLKNWATFKNEGVGSTKQMSFLFIHLRNFIHCHTRSFESAKFLFYIILLDNC